MTATIDILDPDGQFNWDYLKCLDLDYPSLEGFKTTHVYKNGAVVLNAATATAVHELCVESKLKSTAAAASSRDLGLLQSAGYVLESATNSAAFYAARNAYHAESARRESNFKMVLIAREGLTDNPKVELCYSKAYEQAHSAGLAEVANKFIDLAELIR
jgi:hypothetical protein